VETCFKFETKIREEKLINVLIKLKIILFSITFSDIAIQGKIDLMPKLTETK